MVIFYKNKIHFYHFHSEIIKKFHFDTNDQILY